MPFFYSTANTISQRSASQAAAASLPSYPRAQVPRGTTVRFPILYSEERDEYIRANGIFDAEEPRNNGRRLYSANGISTAWFKYQETMMQYVNQQLADRMVEGSIRDVIVQTARNPRQAALFNHASMAFNNEFFFKGILTAPPRRGVEDKQIPEVLAKALTQDFGGIENLKLEMLAMAEAMFGPGFVWLVRVNASALSTGGSGGASRKFMLLPTYLAGSPLAGAHNRMQPLDMNTQNVAAAESAGGVEGLARSQLPQHLKVQNHAGPIGQYAKPIGTPRAYGGVDVTPCLCVSTWEHSYLVDWRFMKRGFLERWWTFINWQRVMKLSDVEGDETRKMRLQGSRSFRFV